MVTVGPAKDFDQISAVYDETRHPLDDATVAGLLEFLHEHRWSSVLEVGVGTGRVAQPIVAGGLSVVGVDASRGMLRRAAAKGVPRLLRGTAYRLPFSDRTFDIALFVHVLHMLEEPGAALREAARVSRDGVIALMDRYPGRTDRSVPTEPGPRELIRQVLAEAGYPDLLRAGPRVREREILRAYPPRDMRTLSDRVVSEPLAKQLETLEKRGYRHVLKVPPEELARAVAAARERVGDRVVTFRRVESVVWWPSVPPEPLGTPAPEAAP